MTYLTVIMETESDKYNQKESTKFWKWLLFLFLVDANRC
jgi:hypothetical protein